MPTAKIYSYGHLRVPSIIAKLQAIYDRLRSPEFKGGAYANKVRPFSDIVFSKTYRTLKNKTRKGLRFLEVLEPYFNKETGDISYVKVSRWCDVVDFNPSSSQQIIKYIKWKIQELKKSEDPEERKKADAYYVPIDIKKKKETTASKELKELYERTGDPLLGATVEYRSIQTNLNNYYPNWEPWDDGSVHPKFQFKPPSVQLNSVEPNGQNLSKHTFYGQVFRRMVEAKKGHVFLEFDKSRFHVVMMGYLANSPAYIRFGQLDCHGIFTSWIIGEKSLEVDLNEPDDVIKAKIKEIRANDAWNKIRDTQAKPTVLGNQLGLGHMKMFYMNRRSMPNSKFAKWLQDMLNERFPEIDATKDAITQECYNHPDNVITIPFGFNRYLYDVLRWQFDKKFNKFKLVHGGDYEKAIAFPVQGNAFGMMRDEWYRMNDGKDTYGQGRQNAFEEFGFINTIHDSNMFHSRLSAMERAIRLVFAVMTSPCEMLVSSACPDGLIVGTGVSVGKNLQSYYDKQDGKKPYNPEGMREIDVKWKNGSIEIKGLEMVA